MALKDWKKRTTVYFLSWKNKNNKVLDARKSIDHNGYIVELEEKKISKVFKTKKQALAYAKAYMRKH